MANAQDLDNTHASVTFEEKILPLKSKMVKPGKEQPSLNLVARNNEMKRIMNENDRFLKRLQNRGSNYDVFEWRHERKEQMKRVKQLCSFPLSFSTAKERPGHHSRNKRRVNQLV